MMLIRHLIIAHLNMSSWSHTFIWYANGWTNVEHSMDVAMIWGKGPCSLYQIG